MGTPTTDRGAMTQIVQALVAGGCTLQYVNNGEEEVKVDTTHKAVEAVMEVDEATLVVQLPNGDRGWVWFVLGNDPEEVAADNTVNLSEWIDPVTEEWWQ